MLFVYLNRNLQVLSNLTIFSNRLKHYNCISQKFVKIILFTSPSFKLPDTYLKQIQTIKGSSHQTLICQNHCLLCPLCHRTLKMLSDSVKDSSAHLASPTCTKWS